MIKDLLNKRKYITVSTVGLQFEDKETEEKPNIPNGMWSKCSNCGKIIYTEDLKNNLYVCPNCNFHFRIGAYERINFLVDKDSFKEFNRGLLGNNPLNFPEYEEKVRAASRKASTNEAVITGEARIFARKIVICVMDSSFMMGSMGTAVGEKITTAVEYATENKYPLIIFTCSGGARMQEGILSLMQMAKISGAIARHSEAGLLYLTVLTDPTTGGVTASFAMEGDIILSEPRCLVGFAGRRVIEKTINESLPEDFQTSEFLLEKGFIDKIVNRKEIRPVINTILKIHEVEKYE